jgi:hypothetical protein
MMGIYFLNLFEEDTIVYLPCYDFVRDMISFHGASVVENRNTF